MSMRKRKWCTTKGKRKKAWIVDYVDKKGKRHIETFGQKEEAAARHSTLQQNRVKKAADDILWGAKEIGTVINKNERATFYLLESGLIPSARHVGNQWVATRDGVLRDILGGRHEEM